MAVAVMQRHRCALRIVRSTVVVPGAPVAIPCGPVAAHIAVTTLLHHPRDLTDSKGIAYVYLVGPKGVAWQLPIAVP